MLGAGGFCVSGPWSTGVFCRCWLGGGCDSGIGAGWDRWVRVYGKWSWEIDIDVLLGVVVWDVLEVVG